MGLGQGWCSWYLLEEKWVSDRAVGTGVYWRGSGSQTELVELVSTGGEVSLSQSWWSWYLLEEKWISDRAVGTGVNLRRSGAVVLLGGGADLS